MRSRATAVVRAILRADAALLALLGGRIYPAGRVPANAALPFVTLQTTRSVADAVLSGPVLRAVVADVEAVVVGRTEADVDTFASRLADWTDHLSSTPADLAAIVVAGVESIDGVSLDEDGNDEPESADLSGEEVVVWSQTVLVEFTREE